MVDSLFDRNLLFVQSFTEETISQWHAGLEHDLARFKAARGDRRARVRDGRLAATLKGYIGRVKEMWKSQARSRENWRKIQFAQEYDKVLPHWRRLSKMANDVDSDWQDYAKAGQFSDTPDDLIAKLGNTDRLIDEHVKNRVSELALEHAARRAGLLKTSGVSEAARQKRHKGIKVPDYSSAQLFAYLQEGRSEIKKAEGGPRAHSPQTDQTPL